ncbi:MAG: deoxyguanosinetriphosphate triphosphohydrolase [Nitrospirales bacterium]|nr:deoxyguanosinetriphosphate triphosphohydrolase [Nitrospirales bacterium]
MVLSLNIRQQTEEIEVKVLHPRACFSSSSKGRARQEEPDEVRTCFQRDRDRIIHSKSFRRLKHKTQVFLAPRGDHYRTRLTHVLEVSQIARTISRALRLNEDLTEAIALGHDLGHTPFGHAGERTLRELHPGGFDHYKQSLRVVDFLERDGKGLNLSSEVRDGILKHSKGKGRIISQDARERPMTLEGEVVRISDIIAYVNHDLDDAVRAGVITISDIPAGVMKVLGEGYSQRIDTLVKDVISATLFSGYGQITMSDNVSDALYLLRDFLFKRVYESEEISRELIKSSGVLKVLYGHYLDRIELVSHDAPPETLSGRHRAVCDFVAGMTDSFALMTFERIFLPQQWTIF